MAKNAIKGITIKLGGDSVGLEKALAGVNKTSAALNAELRQVNNSLKFDPTNTTLLAQKQEILSQQVKNTSEKLRELKSAQSQVEEQYKSGKIGEDAYRAFQREVVNTENTLRSLEQEQKNVGKASEGAAEETERFKVSLGGLRSVGESILGVMSAVGSAVGDIMEATAETAVEAVKSSSEVGMSFEAATSQIAATMGRSVDEIDDLKNKAKELGAETSFSATEAAEGLNVLAMSGLKADEQIAAVGDVLSLAAAGTISMASAAGYTTGAVKGFKDEMSNAGYYTDLMAKGATMANTDVNNLGAALSESAATVKGYGQDAEGTTLALLRLAEQGLVGSSAATSMSRAMADLYTPTAAAQQALSELGVSAYDSSGNARDFNEVVDELNGKLSTMSAEQANALKNTIFTTNGLSAFNKMTASSTEKVAEFKEGLADAAGSAKEQADTMLDNLQGDITIMGSATEGLKIAFYETFSDSLRENVRFATESISGLTEAFQNNGIEGAAEKMGDILVDASQRAADFIPQLVDVSKTFYTSVASALTSNAPALAKSAGTILQALASGFVANTSTILGAVTEIGDEVLKVLPEYLGGLISSGGTFAGAIVSFLTRSVVIVGERLPEILSKLSEGVSSTLPMLTAGLLRFVVQSVQALKALIPQILPDLLTMVTGVVTAILPMAVNAAVMIVQALVQSAPAIVGVLAQSLPTIITGLLTAVLSQLPAIVTGLTSIAGSIAQALPEIINSGIIESIVMTLIDSIPIIAECGVQLMISLVENLPEINKGITEAIPRIIVAIVGSIEKLHGELVEAGSEALLKLVDKCPDVIRIVKQKARDIVQGISDAIYSKYGDLIDAGYNLITGMWQGIENAKDWLISKIGGFTDDVVDAFKDFFDIRSPSHRIETEVGEYNGEAIGTGMVKSMPKVRRMIKDATDSLFGDGAFSISMLHENDSRMQTFTPAAVTASSGAPVYNFTLQIDRFENRYGTSVDDLMQTFGTAAYEFVARSKLAG